MSKNSSMRAAFAANSMPCAAFWRAAAVLVALSGVESAFAGQPAAEPPANCTSLPAPPRQSTPGGLWRGMPEEVLRRAFDCNKVKINWQDTQQEREKSGYIKMSAGGSNGAPSLMLIVAGTSGQARVAQITESRSFAPKDAPRADVLEKELRGRFGEFAAVPANKQKKNHLQGIQGKPQAGMTLDKCVVSQLALPRQPPCGSTVYYDITTTSSGNASGYVLLIDDFVETAAVVARSRAQPAMPALATTVTPRQSSGPAQTNTAYLEAAAREAMLPAAELKAMLPMNAQARIDNEMNGKRASLANSTRSAEKQSPAALESNMRLIRARLAVERQDLEKARASMAAFAKDFARAGPTSLETALQQRRERIVIAAYGVDTYEQAWKTVSAAHPKLLAEIEELDRIARHNEAAVAAYRKHQDGSDAKAFDQWRVCLHSRLGNNFAYQDEVRCQKLDPMGRIPVPSMSERAQLQR